MTFQLPVGLIERARDVVFFSPGLTMASFMEQALVAQLERAEKRRGDRFRRAPAPLSRPEGSPMSLQSCRMLLSPRAGAASCRFARASGSVFSSKSVKTITRTGS